MKSIRFLISFILLSVVGCSCHVAVPVNGGSGNVLLVDESARRNRLIVRGYGSPPLLLQKDMIKINGFYLDVYRKGNGEPVYRDGCGEIGPNFLVDYRDFEEGVLRITSCARDPREPYEEDVPFIERRVAIGADGQVSVSRRILLNAEEASAERIQELFAEVMAANKTSYADLERSEQAGKIIWEDLSHLRNIAVANPGPILNWMRRLPQLVGDCTCQHEKNAFIGEVEAIKEIVEANHKERS